MKTWADAIAAAARTGADCVSVTVAAVRGSTPREAGAKMVVTRDAVVDTIGGGGLELSCIERARGMLAPDAPPTQLVRFPLGPGLGQCCGGVATMLFERIPAAAAARIARSLERALAGAPVAIVSGAEGPCAGGKLVVTAHDAAGSLGAAALDAAAIDAARACLGAAAPTAALVPIGPASEANLILVELVTPGDFNVVLFGAGHVGRALVDVLAGVDCRVTWVDPRADAFPRAVPASVRAVAAAAPELEVDRAPPGAFFLVMTHSHPLDFELCERVLKRGDFAFCGLIGSTPKRNRFLKYLALEGVPAAALARLTCPIGIPGIAGKRPATIAVAAAAQLLQAREAIAAGARPVAGEARRGAAPRRGPRGG